jgi:hypothetical protein
MHTCKDILEYIPRTVFPRQISRQHESIIELHAPDIVFDTSTVVGVLKHNIAWITIFRFDRNNGRKSMLHIELQIFFLVFL